MKGGAASNVASGPRPRARRKTSRGSPSAEPQPTPELQHIPLVAIRTPRRPPRRHLGDIAALAESMQEYGLQQPISVRVEGDRFVLTSGMRRLESARTLGWSTILAFVRPVSADDAYLLDLIENLQRQDLSPEEEADAFGELIRTRAWTLQQVADGVKRSVSYVSKRVRIFEDPLMRRAVERGLPVSTAEELLAAQADQREALVERALEEGWDQAHARDALRAAEEAALAPDRRAPRTATTAEVVGSIGAARRPRGLTRAIRDFHQHIMQVRAEELTRADRAALRSLFRDLVLLARASATPQPRVFPKLPPSPPDGSPRKRRR
jgi:ParB/RepB/Spo0J family partition protein